MLFVMPIIVLVLDAKTGLGADILTSFPCCAADVAVNILGSSI